MKSEKDPILKQYDGLLRKTKKPNNTTNSYFKIINLENKVRYKNLWCIYTLATYYLNIKLFYTSLTIASKNIKYLGINLTK